MKRLFLQKNFNKKSNAFKLTHIINITTDTKIVKKRYLKKRRKKIKYHRRRRGFRLAQFMRVVKLKLFFITDSALYKYNKYNARWLRGSILGLENLRQRPRVRVAVYYLRKHGRRSRR